MEDVAIAFGFNNVKMTIPQTNCIAHQVINTVGLPGAVQAHASYSGSMVRLQCSLIILSRVHNIAFVCPSWLSIPSFGKSVIHIGIPCDEV